MNAIYSITRQKHFAIVLGVLLFLLCYSSRTFAQESHKSKSTGFNSRTSKHILPKPTDPRGHHDWFSANTPVQRKLSEYYSDPLNPLSYIKFASALQNKISLKVYDIPCRGGAVLVNNIQSPGSQNI